MRYREGWKAGYVAARSCRSGAGARAGGRPKPVSGVSRTARFNEHHHDRCGVQGVHMGVEELLKDKREEILRIAASHGARNVRVFGSVARGEADDSSDIDLLVDMEPDRSLLDVTAFLADVRDLLGRRVDVVSEKGLYWLIRRRILKEAKPL
ncbi:MAG: nucleotidyltransferase family protein [Pseudomonadota bacterium]